MCIVVWNVEISLHLLENNFVAIDWSLFLYLVTKLQIVIFLELKSWKSFLCAFKYVNYIWKFFKISEIKLNVLSRLYLKFGSTRKCFVIFWVFNTWNLMDFSIMIEIWIFFFFQFKITFVGGPRLELLCWV